MKRLKITVEGRVQGVFFRDSSRNKTMELGICEFVRNQPDEKVYIEAEGNVRRLSVSHSGVTRAQNGPGLKR